MLFREKYRYAAVLAVIALLILILGLLLKPKVRQGGEGRDAEGVTRAELESLQQLVRRNTLRNLSSNFTSVAREAADSVLVMQPGNVNGVLVQDVGLIVAKRLAAVPRHFTALNSSETIAPLQWVPGLPFFLGRVPSQLNLTPANIARTVPAEGAWVIIVAHTPSGELLVSPGIYNGIVQSNCGAYMHQRVLTTLQLTDAHLGGGLFDLTGTLQGMVVPCDDGAAIVPLSEVTRAIASAQSSAGKVLSNYGIQLLDVKDSDGHRTLVREVWDNWPGDAAGLAPGDEILTIDAQPVSSRQTANALLLVQAEQGHFVRFRRSGRIRSAKLDPLDLKNTPVPGAVVDPSTGVAVLRVMPESSAARAGLAAGDRILSIDGRRATTSSVTDLIGDFRAAAEAELIVQRPGRRVYLQVQP